jgi:prepilin-type N-terminal cleavage/methylation domain-containing protein
MKRFLKRKKDGDGFTLVELIVVLVILAILAAILVPALLGWIQKSRESTVLINARHFLNAVQSVAVEEYGSENAYTTDSQNQVTYEAITNIKKRPPVETKKGKERITAIYDMMDVSSIKGDFKAIALVNQGVVTQAHYIDLENSTVWKWTRDNPTWMKQEGIDLNNEKSWTGEYTYFLNDKTIWWNGYQTSEGYLSGYPK